MHKGRLINLATSLGPSVKAAILKTDVSWASSATLTSGATEQRIADGALTEQRITPGAPRKSTDHCGAPRSNCLFNDLFFISKLSINRYI